MNKSNMDPYISLRDTFQRIVLVIIIILCTYYISLICIDKFTTPRFKSNATMREGFEGGGPLGGDLYTWMSNEQLYDSFYADIYDQLASHTNRIQLQVGECLTRWKNIPLSSMSVLDLGCGTGSATRAFANKGVKKICGLDSSHFMLDKAKKLLIESKMATDNAANIEYRQGNIIDSSICKTSEFTHTTLFYFSVYYVEDKIQLFKNIYSWTAPGGIMMIEVVNKYKFDPMLQAASPFLGFSLQKYTKDRFNKSKISFNAFDYEGEFLLLEEGPKSEAAEFREVITFKKGGIVRRQKHQFWMPEIKDILRMADAAGWTYRGYKDMLSMGFEYSYMLFFERD
jgi:SAM-dependent methyltransferase